MHTISSDQLLARLTGFLFLVTFATSIPAALVLYAPALTDPGFVLGGGFDRALAWGALLEMLLIVANVGTALTLYPVLRRDSEVLSLAFVAARLMESAFIAVGLVALMALNTLRMQATGPDEALQAVAQGLVAVHDWTFRLGPGFVVGIGNGLLLGVLMWRTRLVPRGLSVLGLIGGPALIVTGSGVLLGIAQPAGPAQIIATIPEFIWELGLGLWLLIRGFAPSALADLSPRADRRKAA